MMRISGVEVFALGDQSHLVVARDAEGLEDAAERAEIVGVNR